MIIKLFISLLNSSPYFESTIERVAINAKMGSIGVASNNGAGEPATTMIAVSFGNKIRAMLFSESGPLKILPFLRNSCLHFD